MYSCGTRLVSSLWWEVVTCLNLHWLDMSGALSSVSATHPDISGRLAEQCVLQTVGCLLGWLFISTSYVCRCIHARTLGPFIPHMSHSQVAHLPVGEEKHRRNHTNSNSTQECECNTPPTWSHTKHNVVCCCKVCGVVLKSKADTWCLNHSEHFS